MRNKYKTIIMALEKARKIITTREAVLIFKREELHDKIHEKYPYDVYGLKGDMMYERKSKDMDEELKLLRKTLYNLGATIKEYGEEAAEWERKKDDIKTGNGN